FDETQNIDFNTQIDDEQGLEDAQTLISELNARLADLRIAGAPAKLGITEDDYRSFRVMYAEILDRIRALEEKRATAIERINPAHPEEIAQKQLNSHASRLQAR
ncbi:hypothetical protein ACM615_24260, partial [Rahnella sp. PAMC25617]|uniref:hypothetical protein n=1 Tax=Rahnella sp. PAMC25617 TaxID=3399684 RepID=UPI003D35A8D0